jgi:predicted transcriptional regulator
LKEVRKLEFPRMEGIQTNSRLAMQPLLDVLGTTISVDPVHGTPVADIDHSFRRRRYRKKPRNEHNNPLTSRTEKLPHPPFLCPLEPTVRERIRTTQEAVHGTMSTERSPSAKRKAKYRSRFRIYVDIIELIQHEGRQAKPTRMLNDTNLSHDRLIRYLEELKALEVIQESESNRGTYNLTQKGVEFMNSFGEVEAFVQAFGFKL